MIKGKELGAFENAESKIWATASVGLSSLMFTTFDRD